MFAALYSVCEENATFFSEGAKGSQGDAARRLVDTMNLIQEHARSLEPVVSGFAAVYHHFDFDPHIPANGYRSLVKVMSSSLDPRPVTFIICSRWTSNVKQTCIEHTLIYSIFSPRSLLTSLFFLLIYSLFQGHLVCL